MPSLPELKEFGSPSAVLLALRSALVREPGARGVRVGLMALLNRLERFQEVLPHGEFLLAADAGDEEVRYLLAWARFALGDAAGGLDLLAGRPQEAAWCMDLGVLVGDAGHWEASLPLFRRGVELLPEHPDYHNSLITVLEQLLLLDEAEARSGEAMLRFAPQPSQAARFAFHLAQQHLLQGRFTTGLELFEARFALPGVQGPPALPLPLWRGESLEGRTLLVRWEQGFGDVFQCVRYARELAARGAEVLVEVAPGAATVLGTCPGVARAVCGDLVLPAGSCQVPIMSLPRLLGLGAPADVPWPGPYLGVPAEARGRAEIDARLAAAPPGRRLGLVWSGNPRHGRDKERSLAPEQVELLAGLPGITWVSLQKGGGPRPAMDLVDLDPCLHDFGDTAYALSRLDGLVSVDTSVAHLAGAMGVPAWVLLTRFPDWRWMLGRPDSPWYPSLRLWRQESPGDWGGLLRELRGALEAGAGPWT